MEELKAVKQQKIYKTQLEKLKKSMGLLFNLSTTGCK